MTIDNTKLNSNAHKNPLTVNPGTIALVRRISRASITNVNNPSVRIVIGKERIIRTGFSTALIMPNTSEATSAATKLET